MARSTIEGVRIAGVASSTPSRSFDNLTETGQFDRDEVRKVVGLAGVTRRRLAGPEQCSSDLCVAAARRLLADLSWAPDDVDGLVFVTQTPDYFLPSTACVVHRELGLSDRCAAFDVGLGCSGYPYGLWIGHMMVACGGLGRVLVLHGETPSKFTHEADRGTWLLFGDAGSATALERSPAGQASFVLHSDGRGLDNLIIQAGGFRDRFSPDLRRHYLDMNGPSLFNFTIKRLPPLIEDVLQQAGRSIADVDQFVLHQSNRFMMLHVARKLDLPAEKIPMTLEAYGNTGGASVPLTLTHALAKAPRERKETVMLVGYGVGLSWGAALVEIGPDVPLAHIDIEAPPDLAPVTQP
jgi:3-oxoacyl-[acyl-carrier-protein] synthase-3